MKITQSPIKELVHLAESSQIINSGEKKGYINSIESGFRLIDNLILPELKDSIDIWTELDNFGYNEFGFEEQELVLILDSLFAIPSNDFVQVPLKLNKSFEGNYFFNISTEKFTKALNGEFRRSVSGDDFVLRVEADLNMPLRVSITNSNGESSLISKRFKIPIYTYEIPY